MQSGIKQKYWLALFWLSPVWALAAETQAEAQTDAETAPVASAPPAADSRSALFPGTESLVAVPVLAASGVPQLDETEWLSKPEKQGQLIVRQAFEDKPVGVALILTADPGAQSAGSFAGQLRTSLPTANWHTYLLSVPLLPTQSGGGGADQALSTWQQTVAERVRQALALIAQSHAQLPRVVLGEGQVGVPLAGLADLAADGLVLLNLPVPRGLAGLAQAPQPTLLLQVLPYRVPRGFPLAESVATRQLPRISPRQPKSLLLRQVRGWLRQYEREGPMVEPQGLEASALQSGQAPASQPAS